MKKTATALGVTLGLFLGTSGAVSASPVVYCASPTEGHYVYAKKHDRGLRIYEVVENAWSEDDFRSTLLFTHCPSEQLLRIVSTDDNQGVSRARRILVEIIADEKRQSFDEVAAYLAYFDYNAEVDKISDDGCMCTEKL